MTNLKFRLDLSMLGWTTVMLLLLGFAFLRPVDEKVIVIAPPGTSETEMMRMIVAADGTFVSGSIRPWIAVAQSSRHHFWLRLLQSGAIGVINDVVGYGCK